LTFVYCIVLCLIVLCMYYVVFLTSFMSNCCMTICGTTKWYGCKCMYIYVFFHRHGGLPRRLFRFSDKHFLYISDLSHVCPVFLIFLDLFILMIFFKSSLQVSRSSLWFSRNTSRFKKSVVSKWLLSVTSTYINKQIKL
jgi:hypothetical protein